MTCDICETSEYTLNTIYEEELCLECFWLVIQARAIEKRSKPLKTLWDYQ